MKCVSRALFIGLSCNVCGKEGGTNNPSFVCSNDTTVAASPNIPWQQADLLPPIVLRDWDNGNMNFVDPIPADVPAIIRDITVTLEGRYNCGERCTEGASFVLLLNSVSVASGQFPSFVKRFCSLFLCLSLWCLVSLSLFSARVDVIAETAGFPLPIPQAIKGSLEAGPPMLEVRSTLSNSFCPISTFRLSSACPRYASCCAAVSVILHFFVVRSI